MPLKTVYCSGPISNINYDNAVDWYVDLQHRLHTSISTVRPMRGKAFLAQQDRTVSDTAQEPTVEFTEIQSMMLTPQHIGNRDAWDVANVDAVVCNHTYADGVSIGSILEVGMAWALRKPIVMVTRRDDAALNQHPMLRQYATGWFHDIQPAADYVNTLFEGYL